MPIKFLKYYKEQHCQEKFLLLQLLPKSLLELCTKSPTYIGASLMEDLIEDTSVHGIGFAAGKADAYTVNFVCDCIDDHLEE